MRNRTHSDAPIVSDRVVLTLTPEALILASLWRAAPHFVESCSPIEMADLRRLPGRFFEQSDRSLCC
jgi:hypothetical protein